MSAANVWAPASIPGSTDDADQDRRTPPALVAGQDVPPPPVDLYGDPIPRPSWSSLDRPWPGRVWCNPPWNEIEPFIRKGWHEVQAGNADVVVYLLPARTSTRWYHWAMSRGFRVYPIVGRVAYGNSGSSPFEHSLVLVIDRPIVAGDYR